MAPPSTPPAGGRHRPSNYEPAEPSSSTHPAPNRPTTSEQPHSPLPINESSSGDYFGPVPSTRSRLSVPVTSQNRLSSGSDSRSPNRQRRDQRPEQTRQPSIRLRRNSNNSLASLRSSSSNPQLPFNEGDGGGRPRSISQPERAHLSGDAAVARHSRRLPQTAAMPRLTEEGGRPSMQELGLPADFNPTNPRPVSLPGSPLPEEAESEELPGQASRSRLQKARRFSRVFWPGSYMRPGTSAGGSQPSEPDGPGDEYNEQLVDWLDMIDPEVQTLSTLTNVQNSLFVPDLGNWLNRRPTYVLSEHQPEQRWAQGVVQEQERRRAASQDEPPEGVLERPEEEAAAELEPGTPAREATPALVRSSTISSRITESHYAALPHGTSLEGWTPEEKQELDDHVRHMLHSRRARMKRHLKGFGQYVRRPLGFFVTLYATLITLFGLAWVLFLIGWIYVGEQQVYAIHIIDSVLVALFAVMGDGLAPFRAVDTYRMIFIARYLRMIRRAEEKGPRPKIQKKGISAEERNSLDPQTAGRMSFQQARELMQPAAVEQLAPTSHDPSATDGDRTTELDRAETAASNTDVFPLTYKQLKRLQHHQKKFANSHSFYKPHETFTHHPFPLSYLMAIVILLDCHSCLQISLGACTWGIDYHHRPFALTTVILCVSITCNITAGLVITFGDRKTRKKDVMELLNRQELTEDAMKIMRKKKQEEEKERASEREDTASDQKKSSTGKLIKTPSESEAGDADTDEEKKKKAGDGSTHGKLTKLLNEGA